MGTKGLYITDMKTFLFHLSNLIWIKSDDVSVALEGLEGSEVIFSGPSGFKFLRGVLNA